MVNFGCILIALFSLASLHKAAVYEDVYKLLEDKLAHGYHKSIRPVNDQSQQLTVNTTFTLNSVIELDDVAQKMTISGIFIFKWFDQRLAWNGWEYGNVYDMTVDIEDIWKPRLSLINTLQERNGIGTSFSPVRVYSNGFVIWMPNGLFTFSCDLDMTLYPFDEQECGLLFVLSTLGSESVSFKASEEKMSLDYFSNNSQWELTGTSLTTGITIVEGAAANSWIEMTLKIKRRPTGFMLSIMLPVLLLSILNMFVFVIPVESGEKITYGITVLLAQAVFMTILMSMLPTSSLKVPQVTVYLCSLIILATVSVVINIIVVYLYHKDETKTAPVRDHGTKNISLPHSTDNNTNKHDTGPYILDSTRKLDLKFQEHSETLATYSKKNPSDSKVKDTYKRGKWRTASRWVNIVSGVTVLLAWLIVTLVFILRVTFN